MSERDDWVYVQHMLDAVERIGRHLEGHTKDHFLSNEILQDAVVRQLEILGEAAGRVSKDTCAGSPDIPWALITGMRHRLIHGYLEVDLTLVWQVAAADILELKPKIRNLLQQLRR